MKKQVVVIHGGDTFATYEEYFEFLLTYPVTLEYLFRKNWKETLNEKLGNEYEVIQPNMPSKWNAKYPEWKLWFEKFIPFMNDDVVLVGGSLGGTFLTKYLSENKFPKHIRAVFLVAAAYDKDSDGHPLLSFALSERLNLQTENIYLYQSKDDPVVPFSALGHFVEAFPKAHVTTFDNREHLTQEEFPELIKDIQNLG